MIRLFSHNFQVNALLLAALNAACLGLLALFVLHLFYPAMVAALLDSVSGAVAIALAMFVLLARFSFTYTTSTILAQRVLVLGVGHDAAMVKEALDKCGIRGLQVVGFYSADADQPVDAALPASMILPPSKSITAIARQQNVSEIIIATHDRRGGALPLTDLLNAKLEGVKVTDLSSFFERYQGKVKIDLLRESWFIFGNGFRQHRLRMFIKRTFDLVASIVLLVVGLPVMLLAALAIKLEGAGPVIYRQQRVGLGGKPFDVLKFRSMRTDAEKDGKPQWAQAHDARVTRVGRFMRLTRVDELPQLFNVLAGQMSLVGPRPERPYFVDQLVGQIPFYGARLSVKPGVTGWAQVRHHYGASVGDASDKLQYDLYYVKNHTLFLDLLILLYSVPVVLFAEGSR